MTGISKLERIEELAGHLAVQPARTNFEGYVTAVKNLADVFFPNSEVSDLIFQTNDRPVIKCRYKPCGKLGLLQKGCRKKKE